MVKTPEFTLSFEGEDIEINSLDRCSLRILFKALGECGVLADRKSIDGDTLWAISEALRVILEGMIVSGRLVCAGGVYKLDGEVG